MFKRVWFFYKVRAGDKSPDLSYVATSSLTLNGGTIVQYQGALNATLTLPSPGASGSLSNNKALVINAPTLLGVTNFDGMGGVYRNAKLTGGMQG